MQEQLIGFLGRGLAVVARHRHRHVARHEPAFRRLQPLQQRVGDDDGVGALALGKGDRHRGQALQMPRRAVEGPGATARLGGADHDVRDILDIDRPPIARGQQQQPDIGHALQGLAGDDRDRPVQLVKRADQKGAVGVFQLVDELV